MITAATLLALLPLSGPPTPLPNVEARCVIDLARVSVEDAERLAGGEIIAIVPFDLAPWPVGPWHVYGTLCCVGVNHAGVEVAERSAWLKREHGGERVQVRGRIDVIQHRTAVHDGKRFAGFTEIRFTESSQ